MQGLIRIIGDWQSGRFCLSIFITLYLGPCLFRMIHECQCCFNKTYLLLILIVPYQRNKLFLSLYIAQAFGETVLQLTVCQLVPFCVALPRLGNQYDIGKDSGSETSCLFPSLLVAGRQKHVNLFTELSYHYPYPSFHNMKLFIVEKEDKQYNTSFQLHSRNLSLS